MDEPLTITDDRVRLGLEATWEIEALCALARDTAESAGRSVDPAASGRCALQVRGLIARIEVLALTLMSILDDDGATVQLRKNVLGVRGAEEVAHD